MPYYEVILGRYASIGVKAETLQEAVLGFRVREYGDRQYMDVSCYNLKFA